MVVISDFLGPTDWDRALRGLGARHSLLAIEVVDPRDLELPDVGTVLLSDPESGEQREVHTSAVLRKEFAAAAAVPLTSVRQPATAMGRAAAELLIEETGEDVQDHRHRRIVLQPELVVRDSSLAARS